MKNTLLLFCLSWVLAGCDAAMLQKYNGAEKQAQALLMRVEGTDFGAMNELDALAKKGNLYAALKLGYVLDKGLGGQVPQPGEAIKYYLAAQKLPQAQYNLALMQLAGRGAPADANAAVRNLQSAAGISDGGGLTLAMVELARLFADGKYVPKNEATAATWWEKAANKKDVLARYKIGRIYAEGEGRPKNPTKAMTFLKQAAEGWNADAQYYLGKVYAEGDVIPANVTEAGKWLLIAANAGEPYRTAAGQFIGTLDQKNQKIARELARLWIQAHQNFPDPISYGEPTPI